MVFVGQREPMKKLPKILTKNEGETGERTEFI